MEDLKKKIEIAASNFADIEWKYSNSNIPTNLVKEYFITGAKSQASKEFHQQGMYSKEQMLSFSIWCGRNFIYYTEKDGEHIWFDPKNIKYYKTSKLFKIWKDQKDF